MSAETYLLFFDDCPQQLGLLAEGVTWSDAGIERPSFGPTVSQARPELRFASLTGPTLLVEAFLARFGQVGAVRSNSFILQKAETDEPAQHVTGIRMAACGFSASAAGNMRVVTNVDLQYKKREPCERRSTVGQSGQSA